MSAGGLPRPSQLDPWAGLPTVPPGRCRFELGAPRHFLYPALLLLLAERPRHGYLLVDALADLDLGRFDRPSVYRALADLQVDGLVTTWNETPTAGSTRHVHAVTPAGERALETWMGTLARECDSLGLVLQRYWSCAAHRLAVVVPPAPVPAAGPPSRFEVSQDRSTLVVEAASRVGPLAFSTGSVGGWVDALVDGGVVAPGCQPGACLEVQLSELSSGNPDYDGELLRRLEAPAFPAVRMELRWLERVGQGNCYRVGGEVTMHGVTRVGEGQVTATVRERRTRSLRTGERVERTMVVTGDYLVDIRRFGVAVPASALFRADPKVRLRLHLEARESAVSRC